MTSKLMLYEKQDVLGFMTDFYRDNEGNLYMTGEQIGRCLGYTNPQKAINNLFNRYKEHLAGYCVNTFVQVPRKVNKPNNDKGSEDYYPQSGDSRTTEYQRRKTILFNEQGIYLITMKSDQPKAWDFQKAVAGILENLRKGYQVWLLERERGKEARKTLTDTIRDKYPDSPHKKFMYKNFTNLVYKTALGKSFKELKEEYGEPLRDNLPSEMLVEVKRIEKAIDVFIDLGYDYNKIKGLLNPQLEE